VQFIIHFAVAVEEVVVRSVEQGPDKIQNRRYRMRMISLLVDAFVLKGAPRTHSGY